MLSVGMSALGRVNLVVFVTPVGLSLTLTSIGRPLTAILLAVTVTFKRLCRGYHGFCPESTSTCCLREGELVVQPRCVKIYRCVAFTSEAIFLGGGLRYHGVT